MSYATSNVIRADVKGGPGNGGDLDFYATSGEDVSKLLSVEPLHGTTWEPACGDGSMAEVLKFHKPKLEVRSSDVTDRGYAGMCATGDFLSDDTLRSVWGKKKVANIFTNPPYKDSLAEAFVLRGLEVATSKVIILARLAWLESDRRKNRIFDPHPPSRVFVCTRRPKFRPENSDKYAAGLIAFAWYVWDKNYRGPTILGWV